MIPVDPGSPLVAGLGAVLGLIFGSFATVVSYRVPRRERFATGRSKCPSCGHQLGAAENIPLVSYVVLSGRCKSCGFKIPIRYPLTELVTAVLFAGTAWKFGLTVTALAYVAFLWVLVVLSVIDLEHRLLPNRVVYPALIVGWMLLVIAALVHGESDRLVDAAIGAAACGGFLVIVALAGPAGGMGGGDVKLSFLLGTFLGYLGGLGLVAVGMFLAFLIGALFGVGLQMFAGAGRKTKVPFGPFLACGTAVAVFAGDPLLDFYLNLT